MTDDLLVHSYPKVGFSVGRKSALLTSVRNWHVNGSSSDSAES